MHRLPNWPRDEINYIWRYGLKTVEHDMFSPDLVSDKSKKYINSKFNWVRNKYGVDNVIEKTCANSLRVDYVDRIVDDAKYIFIFRDPIDVVASAAVRWRAKLDLKYILEKARFVPLTDIPFYGINYFFNRINRFTNPEKRLSYWGPKYIDFDKDALKYNSLEISAIQWLKSIEASKESFLKMDQNKYITIDYNEFVSKPDEKLSEICDFLSIDIKKREIKELVSNVSPKSIGKGKDMLRDKEIAEVHNIVGSKYEELKTTFL